MTSKCRIRWTLAIAAALFLMPATRLVARQRHKPPHAQKHKLQRKVQSADKPVKRHYTRHSSAQRHYSHPRNRRYRRHKRRAPHRRARIRLQPERVKEIQQALAHAGYLHESSTGEWDAATRSAMQQYQRANGFAVTGLPEAKPLMKLGLGPHPLPPGVEPPAAENPSLPTDTQAGVLANSSPPAKPSDQAQ